MKFQLVLLILIVASAFLPNSSALAQSPNITSISVSERDSTLILSGSFDTTIGKVFVDSVLLPIVTWGSTDIRCRILNSGKGSVGEVWIVSNAKRSNSRSLSGLKIQMRASSAGKKIFASMEVSMVFRAELESNQLTMLQLNPSENCESMMSYSSHSSDTTSIRIANYDEQESIGVCNASSGCYATLDLSNHKLFVRASSPCPFHAFFMESETYPNGQIRTHSGYNDYPTPTYSTVFDIKGDSISRDSTQDNLAGAGFNKESSAYRFQCLIFHPSSSASRAVTRATSSLAPTTLLYPNPATDFVSLDWHELPASNSYFLSLYDVTGKVAYSKRLSRGEVLTLTSLPTGAYHYVLQFSSELRSGNLLLR